MNKQDQWPKSLNMMLVTCSYSHFKYRSMKSKVYLEAKFKVLQRGGDVLEIKDQSVKKQNIFYAERRGKSVHLCTSECEVDIHPGNLTKSTNFSKNIIYSKVILENPATFLLVDNSGMIKSSSGKTLADSARPLYRADYRLDSRDLYLDDEYFYFVNDDNKLCLLKVTEWEKGSDMRLCFTNDVLIYDSLVATFKVDNNLLYVAFENCSVVLFTKKISKTGIDLSNYWVQQKVLSLEKLNNKGLLLTEHDIPTSIRAGSNFITVAIFNETSKLSKIVYATKDLSKIKVRTIRPCRGSYSAIFHMALIKTPSKDYLVAAFQLGGLALFTLQKSGFSSPIHSFGLCSEPINGMIHTSGILVIYGNRMITSLLLKFK